MKLSEKLMLVASWLESSENDLLVEADADENALTVVASALTKAADALKEGAEEVSKSEPEGITPEKLDEIAAVAQAFDESGDELLRKQASVLDEILLTYAARPDSVATWKKAEDQRLEDLKKKYDAVKKKQVDIDKLGDSVEETKKSPLMKQFRPNQAPLNSRYCPDHPGVMVVRVGDHKDQCVLDHKVYDYEVGYTLNDGTKVPGGNVSEQSQFYGQRDIGHFMFEDTRANRLGMD